MAAVALILDGAPLPPGLAASAHSVTVRQALNAPAMVVLTFADPPDAAALRIGAALAVYAPGGERLIAAEITAVEHLVNPGAGRTVRVRGYDRLHRLRKRQRVRALPDTSPADLLAAAAAEIGVAAEAPAEPGPRRALVIQHAASDFDLLVEAAAGCGRCVHLVGETLRMPTLAGDGDASIRVVAGEALLEARVETNAETMRSSTLARGWDVARTAAVEGRAALASQDAVEMRGGDALSAFAGLGERLLVNRLSADEDEATGIAQADIDRAVALATTLVAIVEGDPALRPGRVASLQGVAPEVDGDFVLTEAEHLFDDATGYTTRISTVPPPRVPHAGAAGATIARVTDVADPEGLARVRGELVAFGDVESGWMPVLIVGAGTDKGLAVLPEPGDDVLVLLPDGDPARGVVLGGLYGVRQPPGRRPPTGARPFTVRTPGGQSLTLDSVEASIRLETSAGDVLEMTPRGARFSVTRDLLVETPGHTLTFRAAHVEFESA